MPALQAQLKNLPMLRAGSVFDGCGTLSQAFHGEGLSCFSFDLANSKEQDILSADGLQLLMLMLLQVSMGGLVWLGVPCCSWVWLSRKQSKRTKKRPSGKKQGQSEKVKKWIDAHNRPALGQNNCITFCFYDNYINFLY